MEFSLYGSPQFRRLVSEGSGGVRVLVFTHTLQGGEREGSWHAGREREPPSLTMADLRAMTSSSEVLYSFSSA